MRGMKRFLAMAMTALLVFSTLVGDYMVASAEEFVEEPAEVVEQTAETTAPAEEPEGEIVEAPVWEQIPDTDAAEEEEAPAQEEENQGDSEAQDVADEEQASEEDTEITEEEQISEEDAEAVEDEQTEEAADQEEAAPEKADEKKETAETKTEEAGLSEEPIEFKTVTAENGLTVTVYAPAETFPEGTEVKVTAISNEEAVAYAEDALADEQTEVVDAKGVDITFIFEGEEIEPAKPISVTFAQAGLEAADDYSLVHVDDDENTTVIENADIDQNGGEAELEEFSVYVVAAVGSTPEQNARPIQDQDITKGQTITVYSNAAAAASNIGTTYYFAESSWSVWSVKSGDASCVSITPNPEGKKGYAQIEGVKAGKVTIRHSYTLGYKDWRGDHTNNIYKNKHEDFSVKVEEPAPTTPEEVDVYFYLLLPGKPMPGDSSAQNTANYYPPKGDNYHDWTGKAYKVDQNVYDKQGTAVNEYITSIPTDKINAYLHSNGSYGEQYNADMITWYTYKDADDGKWHVDGYLKGYDTNVVYHSNFGADKTFTHGAYTGNYTVQTYPWTQLPDRAGYEFQGWSTKKDGDADPAYAPGKTIVLMAGVHLYAVWKGANKNYTVNYYKEGTSEKIKDSATKGSRTGAVIKLSDEAVSIPGYDWVVNDGTFTVTNDNAKNIINLYYRPKADVTITYKSKNADHGTVFGAAEHIEAINPETGVPAGAVAEAKAGYALEGWYVGSQKVSEEATLKKDVIDQYAKDEAGKLYVSTVFVAKWIVVESSYTVNHWIQNAPKSEKEYDLAESISGTGVIGGFVPDNDLAVKEYSGYNSPYPQSSVIILADGATVVNYYYTRKSYTVSYAYTGKVPTQASVVPATKKYVWGDAVAVELPATAPGYVFSGWSRKDSFTMPAEDVEITGSFEAAYTPYHVEYYYESEGKYPETPDIVDATRSAKTNTLVNVSDADKRVADRYKDKGYVFDSECPQNVLEATVEASDDGSVKTVLKVYFKQQFTVTYLQGEHGTGSKEFLGQDYGVATPVPEDGTFVPDEGYEFDAWTPDPEGTVVTADAEYTATWKAKTDTAYKVEYYYQSEGDYPETTNSFEMRKGTTDVSATVTDDDKVAKQPEYVFDENADNVLSTNINGDGSGVLKVYFKQQFTVTYQAGEHGTGSKVFSSLNYGVATPRPVKEDNDIVPEAGYLFLDWDPMVAETVTESVVYTATWMADTETAYKVEYYYQSEGDYPETANSYVMRKGTTDDSATVTDDDKAAKPGYVFDENADNVLSTTIKGDGSAVLKVYFKQQFTVTYLPGEHAAAGSSKIVKENLGYGVATPAATYAGAAGYTFAGWDPTVAETVTADAEYTATWTANTNTGYTVEHYKEKLDGTGYEEKPADVDELAGVTDTEATAVAKTYEGFTFNPEAEGTQLSGNIAGDGSLVLKLYYTRNIYKVTYEYAAGTPSKASPLPETAEYKYEAEVTVADDASLAGYTFNGWAAEGLTIADGKFRMPADDVVLVGSFDIYQGAITVKTIGGEYTYDGEAHGATVEVSYVDESGEKVIGVPAGYVLDAAASSDTATDVIKDENGKISVKTATCDTLVILNESGENVTDKLSIAKIDGEIIIIPRGLSIETETAEKVYNGEPLTAGGTIDGVVESDKASVVFKTTGSQTEVGSSPNTYTIEYGREELKDDYEVKAEKIGTLTVKESEDQIIVVTTGGTFTYDGELHGATVKVGKLPDGYELVTAESDALAVDVTAEDVEADCDRLVILNAEKEDVTAKLNIKRVTGSIKINPARLSLVIPDVSKEYDGKEITVPEAVVAGLVKDETLSVTVKNTVKDVKRDNAGKAVGVEYEYELGWNKASDNKLVDAVFNLFNATISNAAKETNYIVDERVGTMLITPATLKVTTQSAARIYNGKALTAGGEYSGLKGDDEIIFTVTGSQTQVGTSVNTYKILWVGALEDNYDVDEDLGVLTVNAAPGTTPDTPDTPAPAGDADTPAPEGDDVVDIPDTPTPTASAADVLGARRGVEADAGSVLGASREGAVLGARRGAQTGDEEIARYFMMMGISASFAGLYAIARRRKRKEVK